MIQLYTSQVVRVCTASVGKLQNSYDTLTYMCCASSRKQTKNALFFFFFLVFGLLFKKYIYISWSICFLVQQEPFENNSLAGKKNTILLKNKIKYGNDILFKHPKGSHIYKMIHKAMTCFFQRQKKKNKQPVCVVDVMF